MGYKCKTLIFLGCILIFINMYSFQIGLFISVEQSGITERVYSESYNCVNFSYDMVSYLEEEGFNATVLKLYPSSGNIGYMVVVVANEEDMTVLLPQDGRFFDISDIDTYYDEYYESIGIRLYKCDYSF